MDRSVVRHHVREVLLAKLRGPESEPAIRPESGPATPRRAGRDLVVEDDVLRARVKGVDVVTTPGALVTPLARETAARFKIRIVEVATPPESPASAARAAAPTGREAAAARPASAPAPASASTSASAPAGVAGVPACASVFRRIAFAADHGGFPMKQKLVAYAESELGLTVIDLGAHSEASVDYPDFAHAAAAAVQKGDVDAAVVVDGAGIGSAMAANRRKGVRAATCLTILQALNSREHNDANVLCLGGRHLGEDAAKAVFTAFVRTAFAGGRHQKRVDKIDGGAV